MKMEQTECSGTPAYKIQTPRNYAEEIIQLPEQGESLKSRMGYYIPNTNLSMYKSATCFGFMKQL
jgi:hypothetical protein